MRSTCVLYFVSLLKKQTHRPWWAPAVPYPLPFPFITLSRSSFKVLWRLSSPQCGKKEPQYPIHPASESVYLSSGRLQYLLRCNFILFIVRIAGFEEVIWVVLIFKPPMTFIAVHLLLATTVLQRLDDFILVPGGAVSHLNIRKFTSYLNLVGSRR